MTITDTAPYAPASGVIAFLDTYRSTGLGGGKITTALVMRLSLGSEVARRVVLSLRLLDLIDDEGLPTKSLIAFKQAASSEYKTVLADHLFDVYADVFSVLGKDLNGKSKVQIEDQFRHYKPDTLRNRMAWCFTGLCQYAGIMEGTPPETQRTTKLGGAKKATPAKSSSKSGGGGAGSQVPLKDIPSSLLGDVRKQYVELLLAKVGDGDTAPDLLDRIERALGITGEKET